MTPDRFIAAAFREAKQLSAERAPQYQVAYNYIEMRAAELARESAGDDRPTPYGWIKIPELPTDEMLVAGQEAWLSKRKDRPAIDDCEEAAAVFAAMIANAPVAPWNTRAAGDKE